MPDRVKIDPGTIARLQPLMDEAKARLQLDVAIWVQALEDGKKFKARARERERRKNG